MTDILETIRTLAIIFFLAGLLAFAALIPVYGLLDSDDTSDEIKDCQAQCRDQVTQEQKRALRYYRAWKQCLDLRGEK